MGEIHIVKEDEYGNEIERITEYKEFYQIRQRYYNEKNDIIMDLSKNADGEIERLTKYKYEYDEFGYKTKSVIESQALHEGKLIHDTKQERFYQNKYDESGNINSIIYYYGNGKVASKKKYFYDNDLLIKKEYHIQIPFSHILTSYFKYDRNNTLIEEEVYTNKDTLSHYVKYQPANNGRYKKTIISPARKKYRWLIPYIGDDSCTALIKEPSLHGDIVKEVSDYIIENMPSMECIIIDICESEDVTHISEIEEVEKYYYETYGVRVERSM